MVIPDHPCIDTTGFQDETVDGALTRETIEQKNIQKLALANPKLYDRRELRTYSLDVV